MLNLSTTGEICLRVMEQLLSLTSSTAMSRGREKLLTKQQLPQQHHNQSASLNVQEEYCQTHPSLLTTQHDQV